MAEKTRVQVSKNEDGSWSWRKYVDGGDQDGVLVSSSGKKRYKDLKALARGSGRKPSELEGVGDDEPAV